MKVKILSKKDDKFTFVVDEANPELVNSIRRAAMFRVPVLAIEDVYYTKNSSAFYDEQLAQRLGFVPLETPKSYNKPGECVCKDKGCSRCQVKLSLRAVGPCTVYARDLKSDDNKVKPVYPDMPLVILLKDQELEFTAIAVLGEGIEHTKWSPCHAFYRAYPSVKIKDAKDASAGAKHCPKDVFDSSKDKVEVKNAVNCDLCNSCADRSDGAIEVSDSEDKFVFTVESWGQLAPKDILEKAAAIVKDQLAELAIK